MTWLFETWDNFLAWLPLLLAVLNFIVTGLSLAWVLMTKSNSSSAIAWCLLIVFLPFIGPVLFFFFGYQHVNRPLQRKRRHKQRYKHVAYPTHYDTSAKRADASAAQPQAESRTLGLSRLAFRFGAYSVTEGNHIDFYHEGQPAFDAMIADIRAAKHHIHMLTFIFQPDELGKMFLKELTAKAREGVEIRLLYDAMGSYRLPKRLLKELHAAGGKSSLFLPLNPFRKRLQINMRNHRKILVVDGAVGYIGGLNVGDEYCGKHAYFGFWRDTHLRLRGPAVVDLQRLFVEDWSFAADENLLDRPELAERYYPSGPSDGPHAVQVVDSGPDRDVKAIREITFAAILKARRRLWIASPYFVPDAGLLDALRLAAYQGVDVRIICQHKPDKWVPQYAARFYWAEVLGAGVKIYQYAKGMMHAKVMIIDDDFASVGTANLDNRSMYLNFEVNCLIYAADAVKALEVAFLRDFEDSIRLDRTVYARRPFAGRLLENACRLLSPIL